MNREPLTGNGNAQMATGMATSIARRTRREWFVNGPYSRALCYIEQQENQMRTIRTIGYQGGEIFLAADRVVAFQHRKNAGDQTPNGVTPTPQTTLWIATGASESEEWIVLEHVEDFRKKYEAIKAMSKSVIAEAK